MNFILIAEAVSRTGTYFCNAVQIGFVCGALLSSLVSLPDLISLRKLMGVSACLAAASNLCLLWAPSFKLLLLARFITGVALSGFTKSLGSGECSVTSCSWLSSPESLKKRC